MQPAKIIYEPCHDVFANFFIWHVANISINFPLVYYLMKLLPNSKVKTIKMQKAAKKQKKLASL